ncbi:hypothetical protein G6O69_03030 [Pseudenhygromyxa sp. WMMC2535]|uniref:hypothetical protein n=1 Tax=Pseudenhygromyxa sp. WMMC2535 TaxID=2712867 RepID=UPI001551AAB5|nr:hypothetical protein [Pseudenhygromyxa sp. WMMC2535]NVB36791.1 hypothetical protein [Pseudenhygromyxa sp. WMMC2535]
MCIVTKSRLPGLQCLIAAALLLTACPEDAPLVPAPGDNIGELPGPTSGPVTGSASGSGADTDTGDEPDLPTNCDPLADPSEECGEGQECDPATLACTQATGQGDLDEACEDEDDCLAGLACAQGVCSALCDAELVSPEPGSLGACAEDLLCIATDAPLPGLCRAPCSLVDQLCTDVDFSCNRGTVEGAVQAVCTPNPGTGLSADACEVDEDCEQGLLCTPVEEHSVTCNNDAAQCCTEICDALLLPCYGLEPICYALGISGQEDAGYCGAL